MVKDEKRVYCKQCNKRLKVIIVNEIANCGRIFPKVIGYVCSRCKMYIFINKDYSPNLEIK